MPERCSVPSGPCVLRWPGRRVVPTTAPARTCAAGKRVRPEQVQQTTPDGLHRFRRVAGGRLGSTPALVDNDYHYVAGDRRLRISGCHHHARPWHRRHRAGALPRVPSRRRRHRTRRHHPDRHRQPTDLVKRLRDWESRRRRRARADRYVFGPGRGPSPCVTMVASSSTVDTRTGLEVGYRRGFLVMGEHGGGVAVSGIGGDETVWCGPGRRSRVATGRRGRRRRCRTAAPGGVTSGARWRKRRRRRGAGASELRVHPIIPRACWACSQLPAQTRPTISANAAVGLAVCPAVSVVVGRLCRIRPEIWGALPVSGTVPESCLYKLPDRRARCRPARRSRSGENGAPESYRGLPVLEPTRDWTSVASRSRRRSRNRGRCRRSG